MEGGKVGKEVAEKIINRSDHDKSGFFRFAFGQDWLDPRLYDVVLNTDKLSIDSAVRMVIDAARSDEVKACGIDSVRSLAKLSLQRRVESALLEAGVVSSQVFVTVDDIDSVRAYGIASSPDEKETVGNVLKGIKEIKKLTNDLMIRPDAGGA